MKTVLFLLSRYPGIGGIEKVTTLLANELATQYEIIICSHTQELEGRLLGELQEKVRFFRLPNANPKYDRANVDALLTIVRDCRVDMMVYQDSYFRNDYLVEAVAKETRVKVVVVEHNSPNYMMLDMRSFLSECPWFRVVRIGKRLAGFFVGLARDMKRRSKLYACCHRYVLLSRELMAPFHRFSHVSDSAKLEVITNPVSYRSGDAGAIVKKKQVVFVAQLIRRKGAHRLLRMWKQLEPRFPDWQLTIVGDGELMSDIRSEIGAYQLKNVELPGFVSPVTPYYESAQILCLCSSFEGYPMVLPEAMSSGVIPVAFDSFPALKDIICDGETGFAVPPFDETLFTEKLALLMSDDSLREKMRRAIAVKVQDFAIARAVQHWTELLESL